MVYFVEVKDGESDQMMRLLRCEDDEVVEM